MTTTAWFVSDIHLKRLNERNGNILLRFLHSLENGERPVTHLIFLGDIFDQWIGSSEYYRTLFGPLIESVERLRKQSVEIYYFEGNHDLHVEKFWQKLGVQTSVDELYLKLGSWNVRAEHGDLINLDEIAYQRLRKTLRHPVVKGILTSIPAQAIHWLGEQAAARSRKRSVVMRKNNEESLRQLIRRHAEKAYKTKPFDFIITGHMHVRDEYVFELQSQKITSINLGSWFEEPAALRLDDNGAEFVDLK